VSLAARILVIDDNANLRALMRELLWAVGCDADEAESGAQGVILFHRHRYDLVVTDLKMPGMTGWDVVEAVRTRRPTAPVVMVSGFATQADIERARREDHVFLDKPFRLAEFKAAVTQALHRELSREEPPRRKPLSKAADSEPGESDTEECRGSPDGASAPKDR
jgi:two-component system NtrC family response regulator